LDHCVNGKLGSAALMVAVLVVFLAFVLPLILLGLVLVLSGLSRLPSLSLLVLSGLRTFLSLSVLVALLLLHIVCHENSSLKDSAELPAPLEFVAI
jgi:hypothetical protein